MAHTGGGGGTSSSGGDGGRGSSDMEADTTVRFACVCSVRANKRHARFWIENGPQLSDARRAAGTFPAPASHARCQDALSGGTFDLLVRARRNLRARHLRTCLRESLPR
jgi:hypothetical protein